MASCIAPISKALSAPFSLLRGKQSVNQEKMYSEIYNAKPDNEFRAKLNNKSPLELAEKNVQICESVHEKCLANIATLREELARLDKTKGKYRNKFVSLFTRNTEYAKTKQELKTTKWFAGVAKHAFEVCAETYREELRKTWVDTQSAAPFGSKTTKESYFDWDTASESASETDYQLSGDDEDQNNNVDYHDADDDAAMYHVDSLSVQSIDGQDIEMYVVDDNNDNQDMDMIDIAWMDATFPHKDIDEEMEHVSAVQVPQEPSKPMLPPMNAMMQRLASMRSGIAPKDEDSVLSMDDSFLDQLQDDKEEEKILTGRRSSTTSSSSSRSTSSKECASTVEVFAIAMSNRSLLDRVANMQFRSSSVADANNDVSEEEWV